MSGSGNDFVVIDNRRNIVRGGAAALARQDSAIASSASAPTAFCCWRRGCRSRLSGWSITTPTGRGRTMCGNGARCMAWFAHARGAVGPTFRFRTDAYPVGATVKKNVVQVSLADARDYRPVVAVKVEGKDLSSGLHQYGSAACGALCAGRR